MKKRGIAILLVLFFAVTSVQLGMNRVNANNHKDTKFNFYFHNYFDHTEGRKKTDDSSSYMKCTELRDNASYSAYVYGSNETTGNFAEDVSHGYHYLFKRGTKYYMRNWVYEENLKYAVIYANQSIPFPTFTKGFWSPDSVPER